MAKFTRNGKGNFNDVLNKLNHEIISGSLSSSLEHSSKVIMNGVTNVTKIYERYSFSGNNRLTLTLNLVGFNDNLSLSIFTSGGSQAIFFKINTYGERNFLNSIKNIANSLIK